MMAQAEVIDDAPFPSAPEEILKQAGVEQCRAITMVVA